MSEDDRPEYIERPVLIVPGIVGTLGAGEFMQEWFSTRGIEPERSVSREEDEGGFEQVIEVDPLGGYYYDIIASLENVGYELDRSMFVVTYDWRLPVGPYPENSDDFDGTVELAEMDEFVDDETFRYGVDYLGYYLKKAAETWEEEFDEHPDSVDVITHSTGGLVTRVYLQSDVYRGVYDDERGARLPEVHNFAMVGVPNRGASKAWNALQNNFAGSGAYQYVISKIAYQAYFMLQNGQIDEITGPRYDIELEDIRDEDGKTDFRKFIELYTPTIQDLLATYPFLIEDPLDPGEPIAINDHADNDIVRLRNDAALNLNDGLDYDATIEDVFTESGELSGRTDPNRFVERVADEGHVLVIVAADVETDTYAHRRRYFARLDFPPQARMNEYIGTYPLPGERWYEDLSHRNGDGTVPLESSCEHYIADARFHGDLGSVHCISPDALASSSPLADEPAVQLHEDDHEVKNIKHTGLPGNPLAQRIILERFVGAENVSDSDIATGESILVTDYHDTYGTLANWSTAGITLITRGIFDHLPHLMMEGSGFDRSEPLAVDPLSRELIQAVGERFENDEGDEDDEDDDEEPSLVDKVLEDASEVARWLEENLGLVFLAYHGDIHNRPGLGAFLTQNFGGEGTRTFGDGWQVGWSTTGKFTLELLLQPAPELSRSVSMRLRWHDRDEEPSHDARAEVELVFDPSDAEDRADESVLLGSPDSTRLAARAGAVRIGGTYEQDSDIEEPGGIPLVDMETGDLIGDGRVFIEVPVTARLVIEKEGYGGFIAEMLGDEDLDSEFEVTVGWSTDGGFYLNVSFDLELTIPVDQRLGAIDLEQIDLEAIPNPGDDIPPPSFDPPGPDIDRIADELNRSAAEIEDAIETELRPDQEDDIDREELALHGWATVSGSVEIGPFVGTISGVGLEGRVTIPEGGDVWPPTLELGIKPPDGIGISLGAGPIDGSGFLDYDPHNERYAGIVTLKIGRISVNAIGLISTDVPSDEAAFSILVIIAGDFPPIDLGLGFRLTGAGGIVGLQRSVKTDFLGEVVRDGAMDSVLFPEDPVPNADRILSDLRRLFPVTPATHVFGPIVQIEWGTPTKLTADLGVVLELPSWKIAVVGDFRAVLPDDSEGLLVLNMAASGVIDPDEQRVAVDATLYDSRLVTWTLSGDMALRTKGGDDPHFVCSVGGFNPRFDPPSSVPDLDRVKATLGPSSGNPTVEYAGYFAITANTLQAGASAHAVAEVGSALVEGKLSFDALIEFDPFEFVADFHASVSVTWKGTGFSVDLDGTISGPGPFRIQAKIEISLFLVSLSASVDVKLGSGVTYELPRARIMPQLEEDLNRVGNWVSDLVSDEQGFAVLREVDPNAGPIVAHPLAEIGVRQTVVPLEFEVEKFGEASPAEYTYFELRGATVGDDALDVTAETTEHFAPAQYAKMSDAERLDSPAFETYPAGRKLQVRGVYLGYDTDAGRTENLRNTTLEYRCVVFDQAMDQDGTSLADLGGFTDALSGFEDGVVNALEDVGAVQNSPARRAGSRRFRLSEEDKRQYQALTDGMSLSHSTDAGDEPVRRGGSNPDIGGLGGKISMTPDTYVVVEAGSRRPIDLPTAPDSPMTKVAAKRALSRYRAQHPTHGRELRVVNATAVTGEVGE